MFVDGAVRARLDLDIDTGARRDQFLLGVGRAIGHGQAIASRHRRGNVVRPDLVGRGPAITSGFVRVQHRQGRHRSGVHQTDGGNRGRSHGGRASRENGRLGGGGRVGLHDADRNPRVGIRRDSDFRLEVERLARTFDIIKRVAHRVGVGAVLRLRHEAERAVIPTLEDHAVRTPALELVQLEGTQGVALELQVPRVAPGRRGSVGPAAARAVGDEVMLPPVPLEPLLVADDFASVADRVSIGLRTAPGLVSAVGRVGVEAGEVVRVSRGKGFVQRAEEVVAGELAEERTVVVPRGDHGSVGQPRDRGHGGVGRIAPEHLQAVLRREAKGRQGRTGRSIRPPHQSHLRTRREARARRRLVREVEKARGQRAVGGPRRVVEAQGIGSPGNSGAGGGVGDHAPAEG